MPRNTLEQHLRQADSYAQWQQIASEIDQRSGMMAWREAVADESGIYALFESHSDTLERLLEAKSWLDLSRFLSESLYQTVGELGSPALYLTALSGPKCSVERYLDLVTRAMTALCDATVPSLSPDDKLKLFTLAEQNFGRPALMLSGGGTFGIYHVGVVSALLDQNLLPEVISGTSMGSIAAGMLAVNDDEALRELLATPERTHYQPLMRLPLIKMLSEKSWLDPAQLQRCVQANIGEMSFSEAYQATGREVSITVSPTRSGQKPRILNFITAPEVLVCSASKASCSVPGLFPSSQLKARYADGVEVDYLPQERWIDGSFASDVPRQRIARLHNANYFIVSQANPHVLPFVAQRQHSGVTALVRDVAVSSLVSQSNALTKVAQRRITRQPWRAWLNHASMLLDQDYLGDINIHPELPMAWYLKFMKNPGLDELHYLLRVGGQATWPKIRMIHNQTRISKTLRKCIDSLQ